MTEKNSSDHLAENLKALRADREWSQNQLAERAGLSVGSVKMYETGQRWPGQSHLDDLARAFGYKGWQLLLPKTSADSAPGKPHSDDQQNPESSVDPGRIAKGKQDAGRADHTGEDHVLDAHKVASEVADLVVTALRSEIESLPRSVLIGDEELKLLAAYRISTALRKAQVLALATDDPRDAKAYLELRTSLGDAARKRIRPPKGEATQESARKRRR